MVTLDTSYLLCYIFYLLIFLYKQRAVLREKLCQSCGTNPTTRESTYVFFSYVLVHIENSTNASMHHYYQQERQLQWGRSISGTSFCRIYKKKQVAKPIRLQGEEVWCRPFHLAARSPLFGRGSAFCELHSTVSANGHTKGADEADPLPS